MSGEQPANPYAARPEDTDLYDGRPVEMRASVRGAVHRMRERMPSVRPNGIFKHPDDWTEEETNFIVDCLKQNIPIHTIANMVHCERHALSRYINSLPELAQLKEDKYINMLEEAEYQADRLAKAGNAAIIIHILNTLGRMKPGVWTQEGGGGGEGDDSRIVMGEIPAEEVEKANEQVKAINAEGGGIAGMDPMQMALTEDAVKAEVDRRMNVVEAEGTASPSPVEKPPAEDIVEIAERQDFAGYGSTGQQTQGDEPDPWAAGADSMFFQ